MASQQPEPGEATFLKAARRLFIKQFEKVQQRLEEALAHQPIALAAAVSELKTCVQYQEYFDGVLDFYRVQTLRDVCEALVEWALKRARLWIFR